MSEKNLGNPEKKKPQIDKPPSKDPTRVVKGLGSTAITGVTKK